MNRVSRHISALLLAVMVSIPTLSVSQAFDAAAVATRLKELGIKPNNFQEPTPATVREASLIAIRNVQGLTDADVAMIAAMPKLINLTLAGPDVLRPERLRVLMASSTLTSVSLYQATVSDEVLAIVASAPNLTAVDLWETKGFGAAGLASLANLTKLSHLLFDQAALNDEGFAAFAGHGNLSQIDLTRATGLTDRVLDHLSALPALKFLHVEHTGVTLAGLSRLKNAPNLFRLQAAGLKGTPADSAAIGAFSNLRQLNVADTALDDTLAPILANLPQLTGLALGGTAIGDGTMAAVARLQELRNLDISRTAVSDAAFRTVVWPHLRLVNAQGTKLTDAVLPDVIRQPRLEQFYTEKTAVTKEAIARALAQRPAGMPRLRITN